MTGYKYGTVVYDGIEYARGMVGGRIVLYPLIDGKIRKHTKYIYEHRLVYEISHGIKLKEGEVVHHVNGDKLDNRVENLIVMTSEEHSRLHAIKTATELGLKTGIVHCIDCGKEISHKAIRCDSCNRKHYGAKNRPTQECLAKLIMDNSNRSIAERYGVSDTTVRKWRREYGLPSANEQHGTNRGAKNASLR